MTFGKVRWQFTLLFVCATAVQAVSAQSRFTYSAPQVSWEKLKLDGVSGSPTLHQSVDLNGDGALDLVIFAGTFPNEPASGSKQGVILFNNGDNSFTRALGDAPASEHAREMLVADFNGDQILDIYVADHGWDAAPFPGFRDQLLLGTGSGFVNETARLPDIAGFTHNGAVGDIDGDGDIDILALNSDTVPEELSYFLINDGNANFTLNRSRLPASLGTLAALSPSYGVELADLDGDQRPELIIGRANFQNSRETTIYWNDGQGVFTDSNATPLPSNTVFGDLVNIAVIDIRGVDVDGDGRRDVFVSAYNASANFSGSNMQLFMNRGNRQFQDETLKRLGAIVQDADPKRGVPYFLQFLDVNGDGITDILPTYFGTAEDPKPVVFEGRGAGCFTPVTAKSMSSDSEAQFRLGKTPVYSSGGGLESFEVFGADENGIRKFVLNSVPVTITALPPVANAFDSCAGVLKASLDAGALGLARLNFVITQTAPEVLIRALPESVATLASAVEKMATFNASTGELLMPELYLDSSIAARNLRFVLADPGQLIFRLSSFDQ